MSGLGRPLAFSSTLSSAAIGNGADTQIPPRNCDEQLRAGSRDKCVTLSLVEPVVIDTPLTAISFFRNGVVRGVVAAVHASGLG